MEKKAYFITIAGESGASTIKEMTDSEKELVEAIFDECDSKYVGGRVEELPSDEKIIEMLDAYTAYSKVMKESEAGRAFMKSFYDYAKEKGWGTFSPSLEDHMFLVYQRLKLKK